MIYKDIKTSQIFYEEIKSKQDYYGYLIDISYQLELLIIESVNNRKTKLQSLLGSISYSKIIEEHYNDIEYIRTLISDCKLGTNDDMNTVSSILSDIQMKYI